MTPFLWAEGLLRASLQGGIAILLLWVALRIFPRISPSVQAWAWRLMLIKLFVSLLAPVRIEKGLLIPGAGPASQPSLISAIWILSLCCGLLVAVGALIDFKAVRRFGKNAMPIDLAALHEIADNLGIADPPSVFESDAISTPMLMANGLYLPGGFSATQSEETLRFVLAHELAHYKRSDLVWSWLAIATKAIFFFHPLAHLAIQEMRQCEESACDRLALEATNGRITEYGSMLIRLSVEEPMIFDQAVAAAVASPKAGLKRRIEALAMASKTAPNCFSSVLISAALITLPGIAVTPKISPPQTFPGPSLRRMSPAAASLERRTFAQRSLPTEKTP